MEAIKGSGVGNHVRMVVAVLGDVAGASQHRADVGVEEPDADAALARRRSEALRQSLHKALLRT